MKNKKKSIVVILSLLCVILLFSSCSLNDLKQFGYSVLIGAPVQNNADDEEFKTDAMIDNSENFYIMEDPLSDASFEYTVNKAYVINDLKEANMTLDDFTDNSHLDYFSSDGELVDNNISIVCVELSIKKLSESKNDPKNENIHILQDMNLFVDSYTNIIGMELGFSLNQTEDITRSSEDKEANYFSLKKDETAQFKLCFAVNKSDITKENVCLYLGKSVSMNENSAEIKVCYIPLKIEGDNKK